MRFIDGEQNLDDIYAALEQQKWMLLRNCYFLFQITSNFWEPSKCPSLVDNQMQKPLQQCSLKENLKSAVRFLFQIDFLYREFNCINCNLDLKISKKKKQRDSVPFRLAPVKSFYSEFRDVEEYIHIIIAIFW